MFVLSNVISGIAIVAGGLLQVYFWVIVISALLTWVRPDPYNPIVRALRAVTEPVYYRVRQILPFTYVSGMDFSPLVVILIIELLDRIVIRSMLQYSLTL